MQISVKTDFGRLAYHLAAAAAVALFLFIFKDTIAYTVTYWSADEYSHCYILPLVSALLAATRFKEAPVEWRGQAGGAHLVAFALLLHGVGGLTATYILSQYAALLTVVGFLAALCGWPAVRSIAGPLGLLFFIVPLPRFIYSELSAGMQLMSSTFGVEILDFLGVTVYQDGNVIDLGGMKLEVAEACSGLRYLFPLLSLSYMAAYFLKDRWWKRGLLFLSAAPITIFMNSLRIALIGVTVDRWGIAMAQGMLHAIEGWTVFLITAAILAAETWALARIGPKGRIDLGLFPPAGPWNLGNYSAPWPLAAVAAILFAGAALLSSGLVANDHETVPARQPFFQFPRTLPDGWTGREGTLPRSQLEVLRLDDYLLADYTRPGSLPVNFYVAYYASQRKGESPHSPRVCIPGGGWAIVDIRPYRVPGFDPRIRINRAVIRNGAETQLVYYWFQERGRVMANEYVAKLYLFADSIFRHRSDGALVRLVTPVPRGTDLVAGDAAMASFLAQAWPRLGGYIPN